MAKYPRYPRALKPKSRYKAKAGEWLTPADVDARVIERRIQVQPNGCHYYCLNKKRRIYPPLRIRRNKGEKPIYIPVAYVRYYQKYGTFIPRRLQLLHSCHDPYCVNPEHLVVGTRKDNMETRIRKNKGDFPEQIPLNDWERLVTWVQKDLDPYHDWTEKSQRWRHLVPRLYERYKRLSDTQLILLQKTALGHHTVTESYAILKELREAWFTQDREWPDQVISRLLRHGQ